MRLVPDRYPHRFFFLLARLHDPLAGLMLFASHLRALQGGPRASHSFLLLPTLFSPLLPSVASLRPLLLFGRQCRSMRSSSPVVLQGAALPSSQTHARGNLSHQRRRRAAGSEPDVLAGHRGVVGRNPLFLLVLRFFWHGGVEEVAWELGGLAEGPMGSLQSRRQTL